MRRRPEEIVARARALVGTRFRPQGRSVADGLDCIGVVALAIDVPDAPRDYRLRGGSMRRLAEGLAAAGLVPVGDLAVGDVLVFRPGPAQLHLGIFTGSGLVHGDAGLRRVVERPLPFLWPILGIWRS
jgi:cell wall-associated NlpC family hydrolase